MTFKPAPFSDGRRALAIMALLVALVVLFLAIVIGTPVNAASFVLLLLALALLVPVAYLGWRAWICLSLAYWVDRNAITIVWGPLRQVVPLGQIQQVRRGGLSQPVPEWQERWPRLVPFVEFGPDLGAAWQTPWGPVTSLASRPLPDQLLLQTTAGLFGISPADPDRFLQAMAEHHALGPTRLATLALRRPAIADAAIWRDWLGLCLLAGGLALALLLLGVVMARFPSLPSSLPQLDGAGPAVLFVLPGFALAVWLVNGLWGWLVYDQQRLAALLLWSGTVAVQLVLLAALFSLLG